MAVKRNQYPQAAEAVFESFYVDDGLVRAETIEEAQKLQGQLQELLNRGGFVLRKCKASDDRVLDKVPEHRKGEKMNQKIIEGQQFTKMLGME